MKVNSVNSANYQKGKLTAAQKGALVGGAYTAFNVARNLPKLKGADKLVKDTLKQHKGAVIFGIAVSAAINIGLGALIGKGIGMLVEAKKHNDIKNDVKEEEAKEVKNTEETKETEEVKEAEKTEDKE